MKSLKAFHLSLAISIVSTSASRLFCSNLQLEYKSTSIFKDDFSKITYEVFNQVGSRLPLVPYLITLQQIYPHNQKPFECYLNLLAGNKIRYLHLNKIESSNKTSDKCNGTTSKISHYFEFRNSELKELLLEDDFCAYRRYNSFDGNFRLFENEVDTETADNKLINFTVYKTQFGFMEISVSNISNSSVIDDKCDEIEGNPTVLYLAMAFFASVLFSIFLRKLWSRFIAYKNRNRVVPFNQ